MRFLLDTNILSDLVRNPTGRIYKRVRRIGEDCVCTSVVVAAELRFGAEKSTSARLKAQVEAILATTEVLPLEPPADKIYAKIRAALERSGRPIGANDLLIAAQVLSLGYTLVTANGKEFARIPGLSHENWLQPS